MMTPYTLSSQQANQIDLIREYVQKKLADDYSGHDFAHIERVVKLCEKLLQTETNVDSFIVLSSAYLHDVIDDKVVAHSELAKQDLLRFLTQIEISFEQQTAIMDIIEKMSYRKNLAHKQLLSAEGLIVQDADRLDAIGAIGIGRTFYYGASKKHQMYDPAILPRNKLNEVDYSQSNTVINHFYEKLFLLKDQMNTKTAKRLAQDRHQFMVDFVERFKQEWLGE